MDNIVVIEKAELISIIHEAVEQSIKNSCVQSISPTNNISQSNTKDEILTRKEVCELLGCCATSLWKYQRNKLLPYYRIGNKILFKKQEVLSAISNKIRKN